MRTKIGVITSAKMKNTVTVSVHRYVLHPKYGKKFRVSTKFLADTNNIEAAVGDEVVITECRPLSKRKHFKLTEVRKKAIQVQELKDEEAIAGSVQPDHRDPSFTKTPSVSA